MTEPISKPVHTLILDAAPLLKNTPPLSTLLAKSHVLVTSPSVLNEIRDKNARSRVETLYSPFLVLRTPKPESLRFVSDFARKTGDKSVLSNVDLELLALAYEIECEKNGGDWRLRRIPGQKGLNGGGPEKEKKESSSDEATNTETARREDSQSSDTVTVSTLEASNPDAPATPYVGAETEDPSNVTDALASQLEDTRIENTSLRQDLNDKSSVILDSRPQEHISAGPASDNSLETPSRPDSDSTSDSDSEGWITPSNIKKHQALDNSELSSTHEQKVLQVATITGDFAMQNVLLQINLNLLSPNTLERVRHLRTYILRCHACFYTTKEMSKQFCPRCGGPTLTRVSCSTSANGEFKMHLKRNMIWNSRGDRFNIPKPVHGSSSGKVNHGGGKGGWGKDLILTEDQKEYVKAMNGAGQRSRKEKDLMDDDYLPGILTGERRQGPGKIKIGAGRNVNSKKR